jgi:hypothetical protein
LWWLTTAKTDENVEEVQQVVCTDQIMIIRMMVEEYGLGNFQA